MRLQDPLNDLFQTRSHIRVLRALIRLPEGIEASAREVSRRAGVSHPTASSVLESLIHQGLVHVRRTPWADEYGLNTQHILLPPLRSLLRREGDVFDQVLSALRNELQTRAPWVTEALVFGSAAWGEMEPESDLDVAVITAKERIAATEEAVAAVGEVTKRRFGNRTSVLVGTGSVVEMAQGRAGHRLWRRIASEGVPILTSGDRDAR